MQLVNHVRAKCKQMYLISSRDVEYICFDLGDCHEGMKIIIISRNAILKKKCFKNYLPKVQVK